MPAKPSPDVLTENRRDGAQQLMDQAVEAEVETWVESYRYVTDEKGLRHVVLNGHLPKRHIIMGVGPVEVAQPRVHDRRGLGTVDEHVQPDEPFRCMTTTRWTGRPDSSSADG